MKFFSKFLDFEFDTSKIKKNSLILVACAPSPLTKNFYLTPNQNGCRKGEKQLSSLRSTGEGLNGA